MELNYVLGREAPRGPAGGLAGKADGVSLSGPANVTLHGWVVDSLLPKAGWGPVAVLISVDGRTHPPPHLSFMRERRTARTRS